MAVVDLDALADEPKAKGPVDLDALADVPRETSPTLEALKSGVTELPQRAVGAAETAAHLAGGFIEPVVTLPLLLPGAVARRLPRGESPRLQALSQLQRALHPYLTYEPQTESGKALTEAVNVPLDWLGKKAEQFGTVVQTRAEPIVGQKPAAVAGGVAELGAGVAPFVAADMAFNVARAAGYRRPPMSPVEAQAIIDEEIARVRGETELPPGAAPPPGMPPEAPSAPEAAPAPSAAEKAPPAAPRKRGGRKAKVPPPPPGQGTLMGVPEAVPPTRESLLAEAKKPRENLLFNERGSLGQMFQRRKRAPLGNDPIEQLTQAVENMPENASPAAKERALDRLTARLSDYKDASGRALDGMRANAVKLWDWYAHRQPWTNFKDLLGKWDAQNQQSDFHLRRFLNAVKVKVPDKLRREAMTNYMQADGDPAKLALWASRSKGRLKLGYETALRLTPEEQALAGDLRSYFDARLQQGIDAGLLEEGVENYVNQIWKKPEGVMRWYMESLRADALQPNPSFLRHRVFRNGYFEGEQAGFIPQDKDIGYLLGVYDRSFNRALSSRAFVERMLHGRASDGRPLAGPLEASASTVTGPVPQPQAPGAPRGPQAQMPGIPPEEGTVHFITPNILPDEMYGYVPIDHPAFRKWVWATKDTEGNPIFVRGNMAVHPEVAGHLHNVFTRSRMRQFAPTRAVLTASRGFKNTLLSLSGFHQVQEGLHAGFHRVNPFGAPPLDINHPVTKALMEHGLKVADYGALEDFAEGVGATGLVNKIPGIGRHLQDYQEWLFRDYIPNLKQAMAHEAYRRNTQRYAGELSNDQILELTAQQANAAFGELNYTMMGRNKTFQDIFRLFALAPDFLEARGRFVGQAAKPYGKEQAVALLGGAAAMWGAARVLNQALDNDPHWDLPFGVVYRGKAYGLRSVQGDMLHAYNDFQSFFYHRLNPFGAKLGIELTTGRDEFGRKRSRLQQLLDNIPFPIPVSGFAKERMRQLPVGRSGWESLFSAMGISVYPYKTPAERAAAQAAGRRVGDQTPAEQAATRQRAEIREGFRSGKLSRADLYGMMQRGEIKPRLFTQLMRQRGEPDLVRRFRVLSLEEAEDVYSKATPAERQQLLPLLTAKRRRLKRPPLPAVGAQ